MAEVTQFSVDNSEASNPEPVTAEQPAISWTASEFIAHDKSSGWYVAVMAVTLIVAALAFLIADVVSAGVIVFLGVLFCIVGARRPRELPYQLDSHGIRVDQKYYPFSGFKSFSIVQEEGVESIWFMPLQRFMPGLSIYFAPDEGQKIVDYISEYLPFEQKELALFDSLMHRIRF